MLWTSWIPRRIACGLGLAGDAARLLDASFPGGFGDAGRLPDDMWLNNIPASPLARQHMADASIRAILDALADPAAPPTLALTVKPPELDPEMDTFASGADVPRTGRGAAAAATWIFRRKESRRRRGCDVDISRQRVAAPPRVRHGHSAETSHGRDGDIPRR